MLVSIENLLPHRSPFLFVDEMVECSKEKIVAVKTFDDRDCWLKGNSPLFNFVPGTILMEAMAQCGGAGVRLLGASEGVFGLASIERIEFYEGVEFGNRIKFVIENIRITERIIKQTGIAYVSDRAVLKASWMSVKL